MKEIKRVPVFLKHSVYHTQATCVSAISVKSFIMYNRNSLSVAVILK